MNISIIVPVYNNEKYLKKCIESLLNQSKEIDEIILVDDGSTDSSGQICDEYSNANCNIIVVHKENQGLGLARNTGLEIASGDYVGFIDSDDFFDNDFIEIMTSYIDKENFDVIKSGLRRVNIQGNSWIQRKYEEEIGLSKKEVKLFQKRILGSLPNKHDSIEMGVTASLYRLSIIKNNHLQFPSERKYISEDLIFNLQYMEYVHKMILIPYVGYNYLVNNSSLTLTYKKERFSLICSLYIFVNKWISNHNLDNESILRWKKTYIINLWMCIYQEKTSNLPRQYSINSIKKMCSDKIVRKIVHTYPIHMLDFKQKMFVILVKYKLALVLYYLCSCR